jgi:hypothetical protein
VAGHDAVASAKKMAGRAIKSRKGVHKVRAVL